MTKPKGDATRDVGESPWGRKPYASPQLVMYGNISQVTRSVGMTGQGDGGKGNNKSQA
jgi:hypothetical protein